jgi:hypothetical protein
MRVFGETQKRPLFANKLAIEPISDAITNFFPMTSANLDNHEAVEPPHSKSPPLIKEQNDSKIDAIAEIQASSSSSPAPITEQPIPNGSIVREKSERQQTPTASPRESRSGSLNTAEPSNEEENVVHEVEQLSDDSQQPSTSPKSDKNVDPNRPMDPNSVPFQRSMPIASTEERTSELIRKQMNEIGKLISTIKNVFLQKFKSNNFQRRKLADECRTRTSKRLVWNKELKAQKLK